MRVPSLVAGRVAFFGEFWRSPNCVVRPCSILVLFWAGVSFASDIQVSDISLKSFNEYAESVNLDGDIVVLGGLDSVPENDIEFLLINGSPVNPRNFPGVLRMITGGTCTASLVGPSTIVFAAHCIDKKKQVIAFHTSGQIVKGICEQASGYVAGDESQDWALCLLQREVSGFSYETLDIESFPVNGETVILTGFGCTSENGGIDGLLRIGVSMASPKPVGLGWPDESSTLYTKSNLSIDEAVLCPGDSGGPAFRFTGGVNDARSIVGINSRTTFDLGISLVSAMASQAGKKLIQNWVDTHNVEICGVNLHVGCR